MPEVCATGAVELAQQRRDEEREAGRGHQPAAAAVGPAAPRDQPARGERAADQAIQDVPARDRIAAAGEHRDERERFAHDRRRPQCGPERQAVPTGDGSVQRSTIFLAICGESLR